MIAPRLSAILGLRWRLALNRFRRLGPLGEALTLLLGTGAFVVAVLAFAVPLAIGVQSFPDARPRDLLLVWDLVVAIFLFFWVIGVVTELQRSEGLSLDKLLHLPVSLRGAFILNYVSSLMTFSMVVFVPVMFALALALVIVHGPRMLIVIALVATFLLMVTAVTFQFRGWLAALMANKRRRGTIVAVVTLAFIGLTQLPQLFFWMRSSDPGDAASPRLAELGRRAEAGEIDADEYEVQQTAIWEEIAAAREASDERLLRKVITINLYAPPGWLPYGVRAAARGDLVPGALGSLGALAIAGASLGLSYRTTLRLYTSGGRTRRRPVKKKPKREKRTATAPRRVAFMERTLPGCPEQAAAIAFAAYRSLTRSPQAKLLLMTPVILLMLFGSMLVLNRDREVPAMLPPFLAVGTIVLAMFCIVQLLQNMFGFDRDGFRALVLSSAPRREILLGKNLSIAPFALAIGGIGLAALQLVFPLRASHLLASILQLGSIYLICCMVGNVISIVAPMAMSTTTLKAAHPKFATVLKQMVFALLFPIATLPTLIPLGLEVLLESAGWTSAVPIYLALSVVELLLVAWLYAHVIRAEGRFLQQRERRILDEVTRQAA